MKKLIFILIFFVILLVLVITNPQRQIDLDIKELEAQTGLTVEEFKTKMEGYDYYVTESENYSETVTGYSAIGSGNIIYFDKYSSEEEAKKGFDSIKTIIKNGDIQIEIDEKFKCTAINSDNDYFIASIVGDTVLTVNTDYENKATVTEIFNNLGY